MHPCPMEIFDIIALFIFLAGVFILVNTYVFKLPSPIGLMILAISLSVVLLVLGGLFPQFYVTEEHLAEHDYSDFLHQIVLSFLLFSSGLKINFKRLSLNKSPIVGIAIVGAIISMGTVGILTYLLFLLFGIDLNFLYCLVFGAIITPTDPIAVTRFIKKFNLSEKLSKDVEAESLCNMGVGAVLTLILLDIAITREDHYTTLFETSYIFFSELAGGYIVGLILGFIGYKLLEYIDNEQVHVEILVTLAMVMVGSFFSDFIHVSSKCCALVMGLVISNNCKFYDEDSAVGDYVFKFWNLMEESLAAMLFVLIGVEMLVIPAHPTYFAIGFLAVNFVILGRWVGVVSSLKIFPTRHTFEPGTVQMLSWGALRGGLPIALSLVLPQFEGRILIITMTYVVVVCSVLYQGLSVPLVMRNYTRRF